jgi:predicted nucleic acid-binding protein
VIFLDTNVISEPVKINPDSNVTLWIKRHDGELALSSVVLGEMVLGVERIKADERSKKLQHYIANVRLRFHTRIFSFDAEAALYYGVLMGRSQRNGRPMSVADGMIAAIALRNKSKIATRNASHFEGINLEIINPWTD